MPPRSIIAVSSALVILAVSLTAATAAPSAKAHRKAPAAAQVRVLVDGVASDWDPSRGLVTLAGADVSSGPRALRRALRRGVAVTLRIAGATRLTVVDEAGLRARITPAELFDELDVAGADVEVEASGRVAKAVRPVAGEIVIPATRIVVHLPPAAEDDTGGDPDDPSFDDGGAGDELPVGDDPGDDVVDGGR